MTPDELAQAIRDLRVRMFPGLIGDRGVDNMKREGMETEVRESDRLYAKALLQQVVKNRG